MRYVWEMLKDVTTNNKPIGRSSGTTEKKHRAKNIERKFKEPSSWLALAAAGTNHAIG